MIIFELLLLVLLILMVVYRKQLFNPSVIDALSAESLIFLSVLFFGLTLISVNQNIDGPLSGRAVIFITSLSAIICSYYFRFLSPLFLGLIGWQIFWGQQIYYWVPAAEMDAKFFPILFIAGLIGLLYYGLANLHRKENQFNFFAQTYQSIGLLFFTVILFILSAKPGLTLIEAAARASSPLLLWPIGLLFLLLILAIAVVIYLAFNSKLLSGYELSAVAILTIIFGIILAWPPAHLFAQNQLTTAGFAWAVVFNALLFAELLGLIMIGYNKKEERLINFGAVALFILIIIKYFDWFFSSLDKSLFFILVGIIFLGLGGAMERGRRYLIGNIKKE